MRKDLTVKRKRHEKNNTNRSLDSSDDNSTPMTESQIIILNESSNNTVKKSSKTKNKKHSNEIKKSSTMFDGPSISCEFNEDDEATRGSTEYSLTSQTNPDSVLHMKTLLANTIQASSTMMDDDNGNETQSDNEQENENEMEIENQSQNQNQNQNQQQNEYEDENNIYAAKINELSAKLKEYEETIKKNAEIKRLRMTTIGNLYYCFLNLFFLFLEIPTDVAIQNYLIFFADKVKRNSGEYKFVGNLAAEAKTLGIQLPELKKALESRAPITSIARGLFQVIVPQHRRNVNHWNELDADILVKEEALLSM